MNRKLYRVAAIVLAVMMLLAVKSVLKPQSVEAVVLDAEMNVKEMLEQLKKDGKPSIIVLYYESECCASSVEYYSEYRKRAMQLLEENKSRAGTLYIDTTKLTEEQAKAVYEMTADYKINIYPTVLLLDTEGELLKTVNGVIDVKYVNEIIDGMVKK